jgi:hypothetical protein
LARRSSHSAERVETTVAWRTSIRKLIKNIISRSRKCFFTHPGVQSISKSATKLNDPYIQICTILSRKCKENREESGRLLLGNRLSTLIKAVRRIENLYWNKYFSI